MDRNQFKTKNWDDLFDSVLESLNESTLSDSKKIEAATLVPVGQGDRRQVDTQQVDVDPVEETSISVDQGSMWQGDTQQVDVAISMRTVISTSAGQKKIAFIQNEKNDPLIVSDRKQQYTIIQSPKEKASVIISNYMLLSLGVGILPFPILDTIALSAVQLKMVKSLSKLYDVKYSEEKSRAYIGTLLGSVASLSIYGSLGSLLKFIPVIGQIAGVVLMPLTSAACTYALGHVFVQHFELGGTILDFNPEKTKDYFNEQVKQGQQLIARHNAS
ncbi:MAG: DUF697 domain-containing protein [SAR324 cluster bacterium]|nr:DUF697 domain-containing protein [SAR324 cluster bacterium]